MIWTTAKSTEVNRRRTVRPIRSKTSGRGGRVVSAHVVTGLAIARPSGSDRSRLAGGGLGRCRRASVDRRRSRRRAKRLVEVRDQVVEVLEPDGAPEEPGRDAGLGERRVVELSMRR